MATAKYLAFDANGSQIEVPGTVASTGSSSAGTIVALDAAGRLDPTVLPTGVGTGAVSILASENLAAGALINIWNNAGVVSVRNADASAGVGKQAHGFVLSATTSGTNATCYLDNGTVISGLSGLTPGAQYFLSAASPGGITTPAPTAVAGQILQPVGTAVAATALKFDAKAPTIRA